VAFGKTLVDQIHKVDSTIAVYDLETLDQLSSESIDPNRFYMRLVGAFGLSALALAAIGIYGLISFTVEQRTKEMGVRLALGALPRELLFMVVGQGLRLASLGLVVGILGALAMGRVFSALLFGVHFDDPATFLSVALVLMVVALLACYIPARRAMRIDPMIALRYE
jgi:putative ABC transport system permease protein